MKTTDATSVVVMQRTHRRELLPSALLLLQINKRAQRNFLMKLMAQIKVSAHTHTERKHHTRPSAGGRMHQARPGADERECFISGRADGIGGRQQIKAHVRTLMP